MDDYTGLVVKLRHLAKLDGECSKRPPVKGRFDRKHCKGCEYKDRCWNTQPPDLTEIFTGAASAIEAIQAENDRLKQFIEARRIPALPEVEEIISRIEYLADDREKMLPLWADPVWGRALRVAAEMLRTHPDAKPSGPLAFEDLHTAVDGPVWFTIDGGAGLWGILTKEEHGSFWLYSLRGAHWVADNNGPEISGRLNLYRRPPKETETEEGKQ